MSQWEHPGPRGFHWNTCSMLSMFSFGIGSGIAEPDILLPSWRGPARHSEQNNLPGSVPVVYTVAEILTDRAYTYISTVSHYELQAEAIGVAIC